MEQTDSCDQCAITSEVPSSSPKTQYSTKHKPHMKLSLKVIEESEENINNDEEEECLGYSSKYNLNNKSNKNVPQKIKPFTRKLSNVSTSFSENFQELTGLSPVKNFNKSENVQSFIFGRERLNSTPVNNYFKGTDDYFRELHPEKNDYQKANNYIEKEKYFQKYFSSSKTNGFRSFDLSEEYKGLSIQHPITPKASMDFLYNYQENPLSSKIEDNNIFQNKQNIIPLTPKLTTMNINMANMGGKFDIPMCCFGYFAVDLNGVPIKPFIPKNLETKEKSGEATNNKEENNNTKDEDKILNTVFVPTSLFINPMTKTQKTFCNKYQRRKPRPFVERIGDWICKKCRNLNFAFRNKCNRCGLPKSEVMESENELEKAQRHNTKNKFKKTECNEGENIQKDGEISEKK